MCSFFDMTVTYISVFFVTLPKHWRSRILILAWSYQYCETGWLPCQMPGIVESTWGLAGPVSVFHGWVSLPASFGASAHHRVHVPWSGVMASMPQWPPELYQWESHTPGRSSQAEQVCRVEARLEYAHMQALEVGRYLPSGRRVNHASTYNDKHGGASVSVWQLIQVCKQIQSLRYSCVLLGC